LTRSGPSSGLSLDAKNVFHAIGQSFPFDVGIGSRAECQKLHFSFVSTVSTAAMVEEQHLLARIALLQFNS
jgi:hypothetical protein